MSATHCVNPVPFTWGSLPGQTFLIKNSRAIATSLNVNPARIVCGCGQPGCRDYKAKP